MEKYKIYHKKKFINILFYQEYHENKNLINKAFINEIFNHKKNIKISTNKKKDLKEAIFIIHNNIIYILWIIILINLINFIVSQKILKENRTLQFENNITLIIVGNENIKIINPLYLPDKIYLNDNITSINNDGSIYINSLNQNEKSKIILVWNEKINDLSKIFEKKTSIIEIDLSNFDTSEVTSMDSMFYECINLKNIYFGNIDTSNVVKMDNMFYNCSLLTSINISNFDTSKVESMTFMFYGCSSLISLNLSYFNTAKVTTMRKMFYNSGLNQLNFSNMDVSKLTNMEYFISYSTYLTSLNLNVINSSKVNNVRHLFSYCDSLEIVDMSKFDTSGVINMEFMFFHCISLYSLDLSTFNTKNLQNIECMFDSSHITYLNLNGFDTSNVYIMRSMFYECYFLESLNLSSFTFDQVDLSYMFYKCKSLKYIEFSKDYKLVSDISFMFFECSLLISIDLYNFDFEIIENMEYLFYGCYSLISIDFDYIDTFSVTNMNHLFGGCTSLSSMNLKSWITSSVLNVESMFYDCISLISLDLSNFDTSSVTNMNGLFYNCIKLTSINLENFDTSLVVDMTSMFYGCSSLLSLNLSSFDTSKVSSMTTMFYNCKKLTSLDLSNFNVENIVNLDSIFFRCPNLGYIKLNNFNPISLKSINNLFIGVAENLVICIENLYDEFLLEEITNELSKLKCHINDCSNNWKNNKIRIIYNNNTCINNCEYDEIYKYEYEFFCYTECPKGTHSSKKNKYLCEKNINICVQKYPFIITEDESCSEICNSEDFFNKKCTLNTPNIENKNLIIENIIKGIESSTMDNLIDEVIKNKKDLIVEINGTIFQITSSFNQNNKIYKNISTIKLKECENSLKEKNEIFKDDSLIIFKVETKFNYSLIPLIEYAIFDPTTNKKLDLNYCRNNKMNIDIYIPISINESIIYKYIPNGFYYNDVCNLYTTEYGTDITLYDRKNEYNYNNLSLCSSDCKYINYDSENKFVICQCEINNEINLDNNIALHKFINNKKRVIILDILKCSKLVFSKKGIVKNIGNYIILSIIILFLISGIYFFYKGYKKVSEQIEDLLKMKNIIIDINNKSGINNEIIKKENLPELITSSDKIKNNNKHNYKSIENFKISSESILSKDILSNKKTEKIETQNIINYEDFEINNISYDKALENDKRTYCEIYLSLIKENHILVFTFRANKDYNPYIIKICLFFFLFALESFINTLFFNDLTMHKIYIDKGVFNFSFILPQILYSIIICAIFNVLLKRLYLSQKNILDIKYEKNKDILNARVADVMNCLNIKFIFFFIINIMFLLFFWYYLSCFCVIYKNTQLYLFEVILITFVFSLIYPLIIFLLPGIIRILSLRKPGKCFYIISKILQML